MKLKHISREISCSGSSLSSSRKTARSIRKMTSMTDNNIDTRTALYWCLFCRDSSSKPSLVNEGTLHRQVFPDPELKNAYDKADRMTDAQKAAESVIEELKDSNSSRLSNEFKYIIGKMDSREAAAVGSKLIADLDAHEDKTASCFARELGETFAHPEKIMPDGSKLPVVDVGSNLAKSIAGVKQLSSGKDKGWLSRTWDVVKGYWHSITDAVSEWFWGGKWEDASLLEKLNMLKTGGVHALQLVAIAYIVYKIRGWLFPQLKLAWKNLMSGDALAKCTFDDTDGNSYMCWFDKDTMTWQVKHNRGVKALVHSDDVFMTKEEAD